MPYYFKSISKNPPEATSINFQEKISTATSAESESQEILSQDNSAPQPKPLKSLLGNTTTDTINVETDLYRLQLLSRGGGTFNSIVLKKYNMISGGDTSLVELVPPTDRERFYIRFINTLGDSVTLDQNFKAIPGRQQISKNYYKITNNDSLLLRFVLYSNEKSVVERTMLFFGDQYQILTSVDLAGIRDEMASDKYDLVWEGGLAYTEDPRKDDVFYSRASAYGGGETENLDVKSGKSNQAKLTGATQWTAIKTKYFATAFIPQTPADAYRLTATGLPIKGKDFEKIFNMYLTLNINQPNRVKLFIGPLDYGLVKDVTPGFEKLMNFGFNIIRPISKAILWLFTEMHRVIPNYGWVLIIFSILLKIVLTPLTNSSTRSMKEMQKLQPQLTALHEKYGSDPQRENTEKMKMFKEHNINPMGGCLPILIQMPVLWALFIIFRTTIELRQASFIFWITDLSAPDTIYTLPFAIPIYGNQVNVFPILMALSQLFQQKLTGASGNQQQKVMMYFMTFFFFFLFNQFPSGLNLYYTLYNILSIVQQQYFPPKPKPQKKKRISAIQNLRQYQMKMKRR